MASGKSKWITSELSRQDVKLRACNEAILRVYRTVLEDNPSLTSRDSGYEESEVLQPLRVVVDRNNRLTGKENIFSEETNTLIFTTKKTKIKEGNVEICYQDKDVLSDPNFIVEFLANEKSINNLMVESGSGMFDALLKEQLIDELVLYQHPNYWVKKGKPSLNSIRLMKN